MNRKLFDKIEAIGGFIAKVKNSGIIDTVRFKRASSAVESYMGSQQSIVASQAIQFQEKIDSLGMFLTSLIKEDGTFDTRLMGAARNFAASMGLELHRCFKEDIMNPSWNYDGQAPQFYVNCGDVSEDIVMYLSKLLGKDITAKYQTMRYDLMVVNSAAGTNRYFKQTYIGLPAIRVKEAC